MSLFETERQNSNTKGIDKVSILDAIQLINNEDKIVADAVGKQLPKIAQVIENIVKRLNDEGRLFYIGTGTSGRLGVLDASEIPPTFGVSSELIQGIIAGGYDALYKAVEASEDDKDAGQNDLKKRNATEKDCVIGIAASGSTSYTIGAVEYAKSIGCFTACITSNSGSPITKAVDIPIVAEVGAEAISGSTRMKSGTAQKMILNMISTVTMIKLGFVKGNQMTNLKPKNKKLVERSLKILVNELQIDKTTAIKLFESAKNDLRIALIIGETNVSYDMALTKLQENKGVIDKTIDAINSTK